LLYEYHDEQGRPARLLSDEVWGFIQQHSKELDAAIVDARDYDYDYFGLKTLERSYLLRLNRRIAERPQYMLMRVACGMHIGDVVAAIETYNLMSQRFLHTCNTNFVQRGYT